MKIPNHLNQFLEEESLVLVTGKQDAVIYKAFDGKLDKLDSFKIAHPHYSDDEGQFGRGGTKELRDSDIIRDFLKELVIRLKKLGSENYAALYIFTPSHVKNLVQEALPTNLRVKIRGVVEGNYFKLAPLDIIGKIV